MSVWVRILLGAICLLVAALMAAIAPDDHNRIGFYGVSAFAGAAAAFLILSGRPRDFFGSCVGLALFAAGIWYLAGQLDAGHLYSGSRSRPSLLNAVLFLVSFGLPGVVFAVRTRFGFRRAAAQLCVQADR